MVGTKVYDDAPVVVRTTFDLEGVVVAVDVVARVVLLADRSGDAMVEVPPVFSDELASYREEGTDTTAVGCAGTAGAEVIEEVFGDDCKGIPLDMFPFQISLKTANNRFRCFLRQEKPCN